ERTAAKAGADASADVAALQQGMQQAARGAASQMHQAAQQAKSKPVGKQADAEHQQHAKQHEQHQAEAHAHANAAHEKVKQRAHEAHAAPPQAANPSANDGVDGIQFKKVSDWSKYMPQRMPDQDARETKRIEKLVQTKIEHDRAQSAKQLASLKA